MDIPLLQSLREYAEATDGCQFTTDGSLKYENNPVYNAVVPQSYTIGRQLGAQPRSTGALIARKDQEYAQHGSVAAFRVEGGEDIRCRNSYDI